MAGVMPKSTSMTGAKWPENNSYSHPIHVEIVTRKETGGSSQEQEMELQRLWGWQFHWVPVHILWPRRLWYIYICQAKRTKAVRSLSSKWLKKGREPRELSFWICKKKKKNKHLFSKSKPCFHLRSPPPTACNLARPQEVKWKCHF